MTEDLQATGGRITQEARGATELPAGARAAGVGHEQH